MQYTNVNGYLLPNLISTDTVRPIGRYGEMRRQFLKNHRPDLLDQLLLEDRLNRHLSQVDEEARQAVQECVARMARQQQVDEALKCANPMEWVRRMNLIRNTAEQAILPEFPGMTGQKNACPQGERALALYSFLKAIRRRRT